MHGDVGKGWYLNCLITNKAQALMGCDDKEILASSVVPDVSLLAAESWGHGGDSGGRDRGERPGLPEKPLGLS